ncbi:MAG: MBL fold metallo-hydrolase [Acidobacteriota bacterium]|nr:MBL fold metallo-hydrolase [Acidobacteriota bacterium]
MQIELLRHATLVVSLGGTRILVDPMLGPVGGMPAIPDTPNPRPNPLVPLPRAIDAVVSGVEAAIVTHMHRDHFDAAAGEALPKELPLFVQAEDEDRLKELGFNEILRVDPSRAWRGIEIVRTAGQHGHGEMAERMAPVSGFVLRAPGEPSLYVAGDTVWCEEVRQAMEAFEPRVIVVNAGAAQFLTGGAITMTAEDVASVCAAAPDSTLLAVHMEAINHCLLTRAELRRFLEERDLSPQVLIPADGERLNFAVR